MKAGFALHVDARDGAARAGRLVTPHGVVETPAFMPVATYGAVRGVTPGELREAGAQMLLANTYHLHERPGEQVVSELGGLHGFTGWSGPWLTDSGGYQVFSLAERLDLDETGVTFRSPVDGRSRVLTPEKAVEIQQGLGSDIAMVLDECPDPGAAAERVLAATQRTLRWAKRCMAAHDHPEQALFGIVQGGGSEALRVESARATVDLGFDGYAHGGLGLGEERSQRRDLVGAVNGEVPEDRPRYLMGLGRPVDLLDGVAAGVDLFDCVLPTRHGRHGALFTSRGLLRIKNARFRNDPEPPEPGCPCPCCRHHSRAYLSFLVRGGEALGARLASLHNLFFYQRLLREARAAIATGTLATLRSRVEAASEEPPG